MNMPLMKTFRLICQAVILLVLALGLSCSRSTDPDPPVDNSAPSEPVIGTPSNGATDHILVVTLQWTCTDPDSDPIAYDVHFGTNSNPPLVSSSQSSNFYTPNALSNSTRYYWRIVAKDEHYHSVSSPTWDFTTIGGTGLPVLTTAAVTAITVTTAQSGGTVTSDGGVNVTARGVCWSTSPTPTVADSKTTDGSGSGSFVSSITGLAANTTFYIRAYATNSVGTSYGNTESFTTASPSGTVTDIDGNAYQTVIIGAQVWMAENLKVTHFRNGDAIPNVSDSFAWAGLTTGAYCEYENDVGYVSTYGRLYNWYSVADSRNLAPAGWHLPSDSEWLQLEIYLGMTQAGANVTGWRGNKGGKLKEAGTTHWFSPNTGATDESGFSALPIGWRSHDDGVFSDLGYQGNSWSSTEYTSGFAWHRSLSYIETTIYRGGGDKHYGFSVRCVRD